MSSGEGGKSKKTKTFYHQVESSKMNGFITDIEVAGYKRQLTYVISRPEASPHTYHNEV